MAALVLDPASTLRTTRVSASPGPATAQSSPRAREPKRPLPLSGLLKPGNQSMLFRDDDDDDDVLDSPPSPRVYTNVVGSIQSVLYGGRGRDRSEVWNLVQECYDGSAVFENPFTLARGPQQISDVFCLLGVVPGAIWSELGEVCDSRTYDGGRLVLMTHTLHISLFPSLDSSIPPVESASHPSHPFYTSQPATPLAQSTPTGTTRADTPYSYKHLAAPTTRKWPILSLLSHFGPKKIVSALTSFSLKIHTKLVINETGKIVLHEDIWGLKETIEGFVPLVGTLYSLNRASMGYFSSFLSRNLFEDTSPASRTIPIVQEAERRRLWEEKIREIRLGGDGSANSKSCFGLGTPISPVHSRKGSLCFDLPGVNGGRPTPGGRAGVAFWNGLGLVEEVSTGASSASASTSGVVGLEEQRTDASTSGEVGTDETRVTPLHIDVPTTSMDFGEIDSSDA